MVLARKSINRICHSLVATVLVLHSHVVVRYVAVVVLHYAVPTPRTPSFKVLHLVAICSRIASARLISVRAVGTAGHAILIDRVGPLPHAAWEASEIGNQIATGATVELGIEVI